MQELRYYVTILYFYKNNEKKWNFLLTLNEDNDILISVAGQKNHSCSGFFTYFTEWIKFKNVSEKSKKCLTGAIQCGNISLLRVGRQAAEP